MKSQATVLFADSDPLLLDSHRRTIRSLRPSWTVGFAATGSQAMDWLARNRTNALVSELNLVTADGSDLLPQVQKAYPELVRLILSSETDSESRALLRSTQTAHQFLVKPCKSEFLIERLERALDLRRLLKNPDLQKVISGIPYLPSLPTIYFELLEAFDDPVASLETIGDIIGKDLSMTSRVLHLVNSAFFGLPRKVTTPQDAAILLGSNVIKSLVLYVKLFFAAPDCTIPGLSLDDIWKHSTLTASLAREITKQQGGNRWALEDAMLGGMLHDLGKLLMLDDRRYLNRTLNRQETDKITFAEAEYAEYGSSHAEIGGYLLGLWGMPDVVVESVALHHHPGQLSQSEFSAITAVHVANAFLSVEGEEPPELDAKYLEQIGVAKFIPNWERMARPFREKMKNS